MFFIYAGREDGARDGAVESQGLASHADHSSISALLLAQIANPSFRPETSSVLPISPLKSLQSTAIRSLTDWTLTPISMNIH